MTSKSAVRTEMRRLRQGLHPVERRVRSRQIAERLWTRRAFVEAERVLFYAAREGEVETLPLLTRWLAEGRRAIFPRVEGGEMVLMEVRDLADLSPGYRRVLEPRRGGGRVIPLAEVEVALVPGLAFDLEGNRLGQGGGHYDRVLARLSPSTLTIGLAFDFQVLGRLPVEVHDVPVDLIVTETRVIGAAEAARDSTTESRRR